MRRAILIPLAFTALLVLPQARADDEAETPPPKPDVASTIWESHAKTFDLDGDGKITWEEYQKVTSGFARLDANKDGAITRDDLAGLGERLAPCVHGAHAQVFLGTPEGGLRQLFEGGDDDADVRGLLQLLPWLLGAQGGQGMPGMGPMRGGFGTPWMGGWSQGGWAHPGCRTWSGMRILPWLFSQTPGATPPTPQPAEGDGPLAGALAQVLPASVKHLVAFGLVAQQADGDGNHTITRDEWDAGVKAVTKEDGGLDLSGVKQAVALQGMPFPTGEAALLEALLDVNGDGKVDAKDLEGVFEKVDLDGDGQVTADELVPRGMGLFLDR